MRMIRTGVRLGLPTWEQIPQLSSDGTHTFKTGETATCTTGLFNGAPGTTTYQWRRAGVNIAGQTAATHVLVALDEGTEITCLVTHTPTDGHYGARSKLSMIANAIP